MRFQFTFGAVALLLSGAHARIIGFKTPKTIKAGEKLTKANLWVKRPGTGPIPAERYEELLGKVARRDLPVDTHLRPDDFR